MKWFLPLVLLAALLVAQADDFTLNDGTEFKGVKVSRVEPDGVVIVTRDGIIKLFFAELPVEVQEKYHYDRKKAEAFRFRLDAARDAAAEEVDAAKEQRSRQLLRGGEANRRSDNGPPFANRARQGAAGLSLEAHEVGTGDGTYNHWYIDAANYSRHFQRQKTLLIAVRDFSRSVPRVTVQVYFIGHPAERDVPLFVYGHVTVPVDLNGNLEVSGTVEAPVLDGHVTNIGNLRLVRGSDIDGWIVVGEVNSQRFQVRASRQRLFDLAEHSPERLAEMVARYDSHVRPR